MAFKQKGFPMHSTESALKQKKETIIKDYEGPTVDHLPKINPGTISQGGSGRIFGGGIKGRFAGFKYNPEVYEKEGGFWNYLKKALTPGAEPVASDLTIKRKPTRWQ